MCARDQWMSDCTVYCMVRDSAAGAASHRVKPLLTDRSFQSRCRPFLIAFIWYILFFKSLADLQSESLSFSRVTGKTAWVRVQNPALVLRTLLFLSSASLSLVSTVLSQRTQEARDFQWRKGMRNSCSIFNLFKKRSLFPSSLCFARVFFAAKRKSNCGFGAILPLPNLLIVTQLFACLFCILKTSVCDSNISSLLWPTRRGDRQEGKAKIPFPWNPYSLSHHFADRMTVWPSLRHHLCSSLVINGVILLSIASVCLFYFVSWAEIEALFMKKGWQYEVMIGSTLSKHFCTKNLFLIPPAFFLIIVCSILLVPILLRGWSGFWRRKSHSRTSFHSLAMCTFFPFSSSPSIYLLIQNVSQQNCVLLSSDADVASVTTAFPSNSSSGVQLEKQWNRPSLRDLLGLSSETSHPPPPTATTGNKSTTILRARPRRLSCESQTWYLFSLFLLFSILWSVEKSKHSRNKHTHILCRRSHQWDRNIWSGVAIVEL